MGRTLITPGTNGKDYLGRAIIAGDKDYLGRALQADEPATITAVTPATGAAAGGTSVTITGTNFTRATAANLGGSALTSFTVVNDTTITGVTSAHAAGAVTATVVDPDGNATKTTAFTYV